MDSLPRAVDSVCSQHQLSSTSSAGVRPNLAVLWPSPSDAVYEVICTHCLTSIWNSVSKVVVTAGVVSILSHSWAMRYPLFTTAGQEPFPKAFLDSVLLSKPQLHHPPRSLPLFYPAISVPHPAPYFLFLIAALSWISSHLNSLSIFVSISSRNRIVVTKDRDVFCPTISCSCVSALLSQDCSWGFSGLAERAAV